MYLDEVLSKYEDLSLSPMLTTIALSVHHHQRGCILCFCSESSRVLIPFHSDEDTLFKDTFEM